MDTQIIHCQAYIKFNLFSFILKKTLEQHNAFFDQYFRIKTKTMKVYE